RASLRSRSLAGKELDGDDLDVPLLGESLADLLCMGRPAQDTEERLRRASPGGDLRPCVGGGEDDLVAEREVGEALPHSREHVRNLLLRVAMKFDARHMQDAIPNTAPAEHQGAREMA